MIRNLSSLTLLSSALVFAGCASQPAASNSSAQVTSAATHEVALPPAAPSTAEIAGPKGSKVKGTAVITSEGTDVHVVGEFTGLKPKSVHGVHVHENGSCDGKKFEGAGGHYNPASLEHGGVDTKIRHAGDLGNIEADAKGYAKLDVKFPQGPGVETFGGKSIVLHAKKDDLHSQPAGDSGDRIACGLIKQKL